MKKRKKVENNLIAANALKRKFWLYEGLHQQSAINLVAQVTKKSKNLGHHKTCSKKTQSSLVLFYLYLSVYRFSTPKTYHSRQNHVWAHKLFKHLVQITDVMIDLML